MTLALDMLRADARNNALANHRLLSACAPLTRDELHAPRTSFFPSLVATLNHILIVDWYYIDVLVGGTLGRDAFANEVPHAELPALAAAQRASDAKLLAFVEALPDDAALVRIVGLPRRNDHVQRERVVDVLQHLFSHQIHHRGQAHAMLAGTPIAPPQLDEFYLAEELPLRERELRELDLPPI